MDYMSVFIKNKAYGHAEFSLDFHALDFEKIKYGPLQKLPNYGTHVIQCERPFIPFYYDDGICRMPSLTLLMPAFMVHSWDITTGRLELCFLENDTMEKIMQLQNFVLKSVVAHQHEWIGRGDLTCETSNEIFQPFIQHERFVIYLPNGEQKKQLWIHSGEEWKYGTTVQSFQTGQIVRPAVKMQGLCFIISGSRVKFRIQHQTVSIFGRDPTLR